MAITNYTELQASVNTWMERDYTDAQIQEFISLAEARLNREFGVVQTSQTLTGVVGSREVSIAAYQVDRPHQLFLSEAGEDEVQLTRKSFANMLFIDSSGEPGAWAVKDFETIIFNRPCDLAYSLRLVFDQRFALSDSAPTNWLLEQHADVYLAAVLMWGNAFNEAVSNAAGWQSILEQGIPQVKSAIASFQRATLSVDPGLSGIGTRRLHRNLIED